MTPEREREIERICQAALEREGSARRAFLTEACHGDETLRDDVERLLTHERTAEGFLRIPAMAVMAQDVTSVGHTLVAGQQLGSYTIVERLGAGGMGEVYRARDAKLGRDV